jgi:hypothetical protein
MACFLPKVRGEPKNGYGREKGEKAGGPNIFYVLILYVCLTPLPSFHLQVRFDLFTFTSRYDILLELYGMHTYLYYT